MSKNLKIAKPKYQGGNTVYNRIEEKNLKISGTPEWNGYSYMYAFEGTELRCGEEYLSPARSVYKYYVKGLKPGISRVMAIKEIKNIFNLAVMSLAIEAYERLSDGLLETNEEVYKHLSQIFEIGTNVLVLTDEEQTVLDVELAEAFAWEKSLSPEDKKHLEKIKNWCACASQPMA